LLDTLEEKGLGSIVFSPLEQGILTSKYLRGIPENSRAAIEGGYLDKTMITSPLLEKVRKLDEIADSREQSLAQMAIAWLLKDERVTSVLVGVSSVSQLEENLKALTKLKFHASELEEIERVLRG